MKVHFFRKKKKIENSILLLGRISGRIPDIRKKIFAGYPAKSVSGATLGTLNYYLIQSVLSDLTHLILHWISLKLQHLMYSYIAKINIDWRILCVWLGQCVCTQQKKCVFMYYTMYIVYTIHMCYLQFSCIIQENRNRCNF